MFNIFIFLEEVSINEILNNNYDFEYDYNVLQDGSIVDTTTSNLLKK